MNTSLHNLQLGGVSAGGPTLNPAKGLEGSCLTNEKAYES